MLKIIWNYPQPEWLAEASITNRHIKMRPKSFPQIFVWPSTISIPDLKISGGLEKITYSARDIKMRLMCFHNCGSMLLLADLTISMVFPNKTWPASTSDRQEFLHHRCIRCGRLVLHFVYIACSNFEQGYLNWTAVSSCGDFFGNTKKWEVITSHLTCPENNWLRRKKSCFETIEENCCCSIKIFSKK